MILITEGEHPVHPVPEQIEVPEQTEVAPPSIRADSQQMNGIIEDRTSVSSGDMLVSTAIQEV